MRPPIGATLQTVDTFQSVKILEQLGDGGQGTVYRVAWNGEIKALKWYHDYAFDVYQKDSNGSFIRDSHGNKVLDTAETEKAKKLFYDNLINNVNRGSPAPQFLWPQAVTERSHNSFGYIMDIRPKGYVELSQLLLGKRVRFASYRTRVDGMLNLVNAFRIFHNKGFCYQDLNDGNFFFNPDTGAVLICDNDNAAYEDYKTGVVGKCRFMAPEVVRGQKLPDTMTDRFSMAVILYFMLFRSHPLEGMVSTPTCLTPSKEIEIYGTNPIFVFDPDNKTNRPVQGVADHSIRIWNRTPQYVRDAFIRSFSKSVMTYDEDTRQYPANRLTEKEWIDILTHFRNAIIPCPNPDCPREEFFTGKRKCSKCGTLLPFTSGIQLARYKVPVCPGTQIYRIQLGPCADAQALDAVAAVISNGDQLDLQNISQEVWQCRTSNGTNRELPPGGTLPAKAGIQVNLSNGGFTIV